MQPLTSETERIVVDFHGLCVQYPGRVHALEEINLQIFEKDFVGLIGPNGAGKSTLLSVILGLTAPTDGSVKLFGEPISGTNLRKVGYVPQKSQASDPNFPATVFETVLLGRAPRAGLLHRLRGKDREKVNEILQLLGIEDLKDRRIGKLSGGQSQRVFLAKALVGEPQLLLLDEPTSGVDVHSKSEFYNILGKLNKEMGITIILSSHDVGVVTKLANRVVCLNTTIFFHGTTPEFTQSSALSQMYDFPFELVQHGNEP